jgi:Secretion system C-terminal sorting domain
MKTTFPNFDLISPLKILKINYFLVFFSLLFVSSKMYAQTPAQNTVNCQTSITIQVFSSTATNIVFGNAATFLFLPNAGQVTNYTLTKVGTSTPFAQQTVTNITGSTSNNFNFQLPSSVTTADFISVQMSVTNTNGDVCSIEDIFRWTNVSSNPLFSIFAWRSVNFPGNFGTYSTVLSTSDFETNTISFYPNPTKDYINISSENAIEQITIFNLLGQEVLTKQVNSREFVLNITNLSNGTYIAKLNSLGKSKSVKLVKI